MDEIGIVIETTQLSFSILPPCELHRWSMDPVYLCEENKVFG